MKDKEVKMKHWDECTKREKIRRWEEVVRVLRGLTRHERQKHWNMRTWYRVTDCGTVACAAGWCGMDPWFRARGFKMGPGSEFSYAPYFFGTIGSDRIFLNVAKRPVGAVIRECLAYVKELRDGAV